MKIVKVLALFVLISSNFNSYSQVNFPEKCSGTWEGTLYIYKYGNVKDSVNVRLSVVKTKNDGIYTWKTEYLSDKYPMVKDYLLEIADPDKNLFITDEKNDIELKNYLYGNKLYSVFEVNGQLLTASYELLHDNLIFEVTTGAKLDTTNGVINYSVRNLQRVIYNRVEE